MEQPFLPGHPGPLSSPLRRFLPPLGAGVVGAWVGEGELGGELILDPFGSSPQMAVEAAEAGCAVVVAVNNPITRFVLERRLDPLSSGELQRALSWLAAAPKDSERLESFVLDLYSTFCVRCGRDVIADYFVWDTDVAEPLLKAYACEHCNHAGEDPVDEADRQRAASFSGSGLARAQALEDLASIGDPARAHAEAALTVYPGRALFALITLVHKAHQLRLQGREAVALRALLLTAFDAADNMWAHPEGRERPKQLTASPNFREANVWRALERGVEGWAQEPVDLAIRWWPESGPPLPGAVSIFGGTVRQLAETLVDLPDPVVLTVPPRPNQAYWTLSALWTAWLWGREAAEPIRAALRRRRYDWNWHAGALRQTAGHLTANLPPSTKMAMMVPEAEPRFLAACLAGFDVAGWHLMGISLRVDESQSQLHWTLAEADVPGRIPGLERLLEEQMEAQAEPTPFAVLMARAAATLADQRGFANLWKASGDAPVSELQTRLEKALEDPRRFVRMDKRQDPERGIYWLTHAPEGATALADRIERKVIAILRREGVLTGLEIDREVCREFPGLMTPDHGYLKACLDSYGVEDEPGCWSLREEDRSEARGQDMAEIRRALQDLGRRLEYAVAGQDPVQWLEAGQTVQSFWVLDTAILAEAPVTDEQSIAFVLPGGRASLLAEKARRDPRLQQDLSSGLVVIKFRHIRRLEGDSNLTREALWERLTIDPPEHQDPQLPLL
jgi:hypothetical protein